MPGLRRRPIVAALALMLLAPAALAGAEQEMTTRGEYLVRAGGCFSCHTAIGGQKLAGGRALATPFGTFYSPNITSDPETGIGRWTDAQFLRALREGVRPDGANYFPVFPYPSFTGITDSETGCRLLPSRARGGFRSQSSIASSTYSIIRSRVFADGSRAHTSP